MKAEKEKSDTGTNTGPLATKSVPSAFRKKTPKPKSQKPLRQFGLCRKKHLLLLAR